MKLSFNERQRLVQAALAESRNRDLYIVELFDDSAVFEEFGDSEKPGATWQADYSIDDDGAVTLGDPVEVKREIAYTAVKFVEGSDSMIEGLAIPYGGPFKGKDLHGEDFGSDTDYALDWFPTEGRPTLYHHGLDGAMKTLLVGRQVEREERAEGQWARVQLDKRSKYAAEIRQLVDEEALSFSSGAMPHLVQTRKDGHIERWPWVELSLTPTPANPLAMVYAVKTADAIEHLTAVKAAAALKSILESESGQESEPFAVLADRIAVDLDAFAQRAELRRDWRAKAGRGISAANRAEIADLTESLKPLGEAYRRLTDLLVRTDPDASEASKATEQEYLRFLREQARDNGAQISAI